MVNESKKWGKALVEYRHLFFKEFKHLVIVINLGFIGCKFKWTNGQEDLALIKARLDCAITNEEWQQRNPKALITHLLQFKLDHSPILISTCDTTEHILISPLGF